MAAKKRKQRDPATNNNGKQQNNSATKDDSAKTNTNPVEASSSQNKKNNNKNNDSASNFTVSSSGKKFLTSQDGAEFEKLLKAKYQGFVHIPASQLTPHDFHQSSKAALERLRDANYYQYDVIMAGGKHSSRTFVKRTLVGDPGITYKYLGLRLFAHAWSGPRVPPALKDIGDMNQRMIEMTQQQGGKSSDYNLTLINYMEPSSHTKIGFKDEPQYGMGKISVSWHADSSLEPHSDIGIYHCLPTQKATKWDWKIALRPYPDGEDKDVLPIVATTKDGDAYFLMGSFNHTHQHLVLAGTQAHRISSTHRVAVTAEDTYQYISKRVKRALKHFRKELEKQSPLQWDAEVLVDCQRALTEVEMEWIAQYWLQGDQHNTMHVWWQKPMKSLETLWSTLEQLTYQVYQTCLTATPSTVPRAVVKGFLNELLARHRLREQWDERRADKIYPRRITPPFQPVAHPVFFTDDDDVVSDHPPQLPKDLTCASRDLSGILSKYGPAPKDEDEDDQPEDEPRQAQSQKTTKAGKGSKRGGPASSNAVVEEGLSKKRGVEVDAPGGGKKKKNKRRKGDANTNVTATANNGDSSSQQVNGGDSNSKAADEKEGQKPTTPPDGEQNNIGHANNSNSVAPAEQPQMSKSQKRKLRRKVKTGDKSS